jgi:AcrR family transcriptional regulator
MSNVSDERVFAAVAQRMVMQGTVSLQEIVADTGVSFGSLYHRYRSRDGLLAAAWLEATRTFQTGFLASLCSGSPTAGEDAALETLQFCRIQPDRARILVACRQSEFLGETTPDPLRGEIAEINRAIEAALSDFAADRNKDIALCRLAIIGLPLGAVQLYLPDFLIPETIDEHIRRAYRALMSER